MPRPLLTTIGCCTQTTARVCITTKDGLAHARIAFCSGEGACQERTMRLSQPAGSIYLHGSFELDGPTLEALPSLEQLSGSKGLGRFRLLPPPGQPLRIGLVSCNGGHTVSDHSRRHAMWRRLGEVIAAGEVDLLLHMGDRIYADHIRESWQRTDLDDLPRAWSAPLSRPCWRFETP